MKIEFEEKRAFFSWCASSPGIPLTLDLEEGEAFYDMRDKIVRRLPSWQRSGVVSHERLRLRRFDSLVKRSPNLRFEPVSFIFLHEISKKNRIPTMLFQIRQV